MAVAVGKGVFRTPSTWTSSARLAATFLSPRWPTVVGRRGLPCCSCDSCVHIDRDMLASIVRTTHTTHHTTTHHNNTTTTPHRDRHRERDIERRGDEREEDKRIEERRREKREDPFSVWWCVAVFCWCSDFPVNSVCARDLSLLNSVKYNSFLDFSAPWPVNSFLISANFFFLCSYSFHFFFEFFFCLCSYSFKFFRIIYLCSYSFFLPELILHRYSVEG